MKSTFCPNFNITGDHLGRASDSGEAEMTLPQCPLSLCLFCLFVQRITRWGTDTPVGNE